MSSKNENDQLSFFGLPRTRRGRRVFFAVQWSVVLVGLTALALANLHRGVAEVVRLVLLPAALMLVLILAVVMVFPSLYLAAALREHALSRRHPSALVGTVLLNTSDRVAIKSLQVADPTPRRLVMTVGVSADIEGLKIWRGVRTPVEIASLPWSQVESIGAAPYVFSGRTLGALAFVRKFGHETVTLSLVTRRWIGMSPSRPRELDMIASQLKVLLAAAH